MLGEEAKYEIAQEPRLIVTWVVLPVKRVPLVVTPTNHENERLFPIREEQEIYVGRVIVKLLEDELLRLNIFLLGLERIKETELLASKFTVGEVDVREEATIAKDEDVSVYLMPPVAWLWVVTSIQMLLTKGGFTILLIKICITGLDWEGRIAVVSVIWRAVELRDDVVAAMLLIVVETVRDRIELERRYYAAPLSPAKLRTIKSPSW